MGREETQGQNPRKGQCLRTCRGRDEEKQWGRWDVARCQGRSVRRREGLGGHACGGFCFHCRWGGGVGRAPAGAGGGHSLPLQGKSSLVIYLLRCASLPPEEKTWT